MMNDKRIDAPFLSKFNRKTPFLTRDEFVKSIIDEIGNILSSRLKSNEYNPFDYGIIDLPSIENSAEALDKFKENCRKSILKFEPRVSDVIITKCFVDNTNQSLRLEVTIVVKNDSCAYSFNLRY